MGAVGALAGPTVGIPGEDAVGQPLSERRCTIDGGAGAESIAGSGEDVGLSCTVGVLSCRSPADASAGGTASGKSNRGSLLTSSEGASGTPSVEVIVSFTPDARCIRIP